jgi:HAE1 family hydrophobic/amphiphilic exporter-1
LRGLIRQSVQRPVAVSMLFVAVGLLAVAAWFDLPIDVDITGEFPEISVQTGWGMAAPESVQALVTSPIESLAVTIPGVRHVISESRRGSSMVRIELDEDINIDLAVFELTDRLALLREDFPPGTRTPQITQYVPQEFAEFQSGQFIQYGLTSPAPLNELRSWALDNLVVPFAAIEGVAEVEVRGGTDPHLRVSLDPELCELYGFSAAHVRQAIESLATSWPVGHLEVDGTAYSVRVAADLDDVETLMRLPIGKVGDSLVRVSDVGTIETAFEKAANYDRIDGEQRVTLRISRRPGSDVLQVAKAVRARMASLEEDLPAGIGVELLLDTPAELEEELALLTRRLGVILVIVVVLLLVMLRDIRTPLFLFGSLLAALSLTIVALYHFDVPVNVLTLTGLALAFGMLVDNAVVVLENIVRYREAGFGREEAAERGTAEVVVPVLAATLTTIGVFVPFVIFQGRLREYYLPLALAVTFALAASLVVALTLMPAAAGRGWVVRAPRIGREPGRRYRRVLGIGLRHPWLVVALVVAMGGGSWWLFQEEVTRGGFQFSFGARDRLGVSLELPTGSEPGLVDLELQPFEEYVMGLPDIERVEVSVSGDRAGLTVTFPPEVENTAYPLIVKDELKAMATRYAGVGMYVYGFDQDSFYSDGIDRGPSYNSGIQLLGYSYDQLGEFGEGIARMARRNPRVEDAVVTTGGRYRRSNAGSELMLNVRRQVLADHGLTVEQVVWQIRSLLQGDTSGSKLVVGRQEWEYRVKVEGVDERTLAEILDTQVVGTSGRGLRLADVLEVEARSVPGVITREDQRYDRWVRWEYRGSSRARANYQEAIFESIELPPGYTARIPEGFFLSQEEQQQVRNVAIAALIIVFIVLASLYESLIQPFIVLLAVPCALVGVVLIFYFTGKAFDPSAMIGVVLLGGIVVNNAIILVDHINLRRADGLELSEAILRGAAERVRPILVTSITTIGGLLPLVLVTSSEATSSGTEDLWSNLALATIGGLSAATVLTLTVIPVLYLLAERGRVAGGRMGSRIVQIWRLLPD